MQPSIEQLRSVSWAVEYGWDLQITDSPFSDWFPAKQVSVEPLPVGTYDFKAGFGGFSIPAEYSPRALSIVFYDADDYRLIGWLERWVEETIFNNGQYVSALETCVKDIIVKRLSRTKQVVSTKTYTVFPKTPPTFAGTSESQASLYTAGFTIVGEK